MRRRYVLGETSNQALSYDNHFVAEWRRWFDWKTRAQDGRQLRCKRQRNQQEDCCTFHVLQCYPNQARHGKLIIIDFTISCVLTAKPPQHNDEGTLDHCEPVVKLPDDNQAVETNRIKRIEKNQRRRIWNLEFRI